MSLSFRVQVQKIGITVPAVIAVGRAAISSSQVTSPCSRYFSMMPLVAFDDGVEHEAAFDRDVDRAAGRLGLRRIEDADDARDIMTRIDRGVEEDAAFAEGVADHLEELGELDVVAVEPIDDQHAGEPFLAGLAEESPRVDLDAGGGVDDDDRGFDRVQDAESLANEIGFAGGIEEIDALAGVVEMEDVRVDRVVEVLFLVVEIGDAGAVIDRSSSFDGVGFVEKCIRQRGLARNLVAYECNGADVVHGIRNSGRHDEAPVLHG